MVNTINNLSFKGFYQKKNQVFSDKQNKIIDDIKSKLGDKIDTNDFMVSTGAIKDTVELIHFTTGLKQHQTGIKKSFIFNKGTDKLIGVYDENNTFKTED